MFRSLADHLAPVVASRTPEELALIAGFLEEVGTATAAARTEVRGARAESD